MTLFAFSPPDFRETPTLVLTIRLKWIASLERFSFPRAVGLTHHAAEIEAELARRVGRIHPRGIFNGTDFEVPFPPHDPQQTVAVPAGDFDTLAALLTGEVHHAAR